MTIPASPALLCTKKVPGPCWNKATEVLYVREHKWTDEWETYFRCAAHPAADDVPMIRRISPLAETRIEQLGA
jgi:hypothetical protein